VRAHLGYVRGLLDGRATLSQRRRLVASGGWLSLLAATLLIDQSQDDAGGAYLRTAADLAREAGHAELAAWCAETRAWQLLTAGDYRRAVELSRAAQDIAPEGSSARIQATAQEGRAWARLGDSGQTRAALAAVERLVSPLPPPERPEHHYVYDPPKARVYVATTLAWLGDSAAEEAARDILGALLADASPRLRRIALARLDLALALAGAGKHDEAAASALDAVRSGRLALVDRPRFREITAAVSAAGVPEARDLAEAYRAELAAHPAIGG
jgi:tetratricopeptide (TPR) repeat protein